MTLNVNGFETEADYTDSFIKEELCPLIGRLRDLRKEKEYRIIVFLAAAPGAGKSTLAAFLQTLGDPGEIQALGIDGFHYSNAYLETHETIRDGKKLLLKNIKGSPETMDLPGLRKKLKALRTGESVRFPVYDRRIHDPGAEEVPVTGRILILEGNWLLLEEKPWAELKKYADYTVRIEVPEEILRRRLIGRKMLGGYSPEEAKAWYETVDGRNVQYFYMHSAEADLILRPCSGS